MNNQNFQKADIAAYYNSTQNHYQRWWGLKDTLSVHYGIWEHDIDSFSESLIRTNEVMARLASISPEQRVLDAGCGVGGASFFLANRFNCSVDGITLSEKQIELAQQKVREFHLPTINFSLQDYTQTNFTEDEFDVVWACESVCHTDHKEEFFREASRVLRPGGRIVLADYFLPDNPISDHRNWIKKWLDLWGISRIVRETEMINQASNHGLELQSTSDYTQEIHKSAAWMYRAALLGALPSELYNLFKPKVSKFAKHHYRSGYYQYKALKAGLWKYKILVFEKP